MSKRGRKLRQTKWLQAARMMGLTLRNGAAFLRDIAHLGADDAFSRARIVQNSGGGYIVPTIYTDAVVKMVGPVRVWVNDREVHANSIRIDVFRYMAPEYNHISDREKSQARVPPPPAQP